jgi:hypothetical protein
MTERARAFLLQSVREFRRREAGSRNPRSGVRDKGCADWIMYHVDGSRRQGAGEADLDKALELADETGGGPERASCTQTRRLRHSAACGGEISR